MSLAAAGLGFILTFLTLLGVPLTAFVAGLGAALLLALTRGSLVAAVGALTIGLLSDGIASRSASRGRGHIAQALSVVVFGRILGPPLGVGAWWLYARPDGLASSLRQAGFARVARLVGILAAFAMLAIGMAG